MLQLLYPADASAAALGRERYVRPPVIQALAETLGFPFWFSHFVLSRAGVDATRVPARALGREAGRWPVVVFSSGLLGCLEMYTQFGRELAAAGAIVVLVEHEDGSGSYAEDACTGEVLRPQPPPRNYSGSRRELIRWRRPFLRKRVEELRQVVDFVRQTAGGVVKSAHQGAVEDEGHGLLFDLMSLADPSAVILAGHSFGTASVLLALQQGLAGVVRGALLYDPWLAPVPDRAINAGVPVPYAIFLSGEWAGYSHEVARIRALGRRRKAVAVACVAGTRHQWISDATFWLPQFMLRHLHVLGPADRQLAHAATAQATRLALEELLSERPCRAVFRPTFRAWARSPVESSLSSDLAVLHPQLSLDLMPL